jgi:hypothetical protein
MNHYISLAMPKSASEINYGSVFSWYWRFIINIHRTAATLLLRALDLLRDD